MSFSTSGHRAFPAARPGRAEFAPTPASTSLEKPFVSTIHYHGIPRPPRICWPAVLISIALHAGLLLGFNRHPAPPKAVAAFDLADYQIQMMPIPEDEEDQKPKELNDEETVEAPSVSVPMLADVPVNIPLDSAFVQQLDYTIPLKSDASLGKLVNIPVNIHRGRPSEASIKNLFNMSDLDRRPEPIAQPAPQFPFEYKATVEYAQVVVGFVIDTNGNVIMPYIIRSTHSGFDNAAIVGVSKWKFRPGYKAGRKVNTRAEQTLEFTLTDEGRN